MLTNEEYISTGGNQCPRCESNNIHAGEHEFFEHAAFAQEINCHDCGFEWYEEYKLIRFTDVEALKTRIK